MVFRALTKFRLLTKMARYRIAHYLTADHHDPYLSRLKYARDQQARIAVIRRIARLGQGNFGDHRYCREGVWELRIDMGPGYRVYYATAGPQRVLLLCAGDKRNQTNDIARAVAYWNDWQQRKDDENPPA